MKRQELIDFLDNIRDYERESHNMIGFDERTSGEFVDQYLTDHPKSEIPIKKKKSKERYQEYLHSDSALSFINWLRSK